MQPCLSSKVKLHDTCGVNNLHGMPGVLAGIASACLAALSSYDKWGDRYVLIVITIDIHVYSNSVCVSYFRLEMLCIIVPQSTGSVLTSLVLSASPVPLYNNL